MVDASLVILNTYHFDPAIFVARFPLKPVPEILPPAVAQVTPLPREICENVNPETDGEMVAMGSAGQLLVVIAVKLTAVGPAKNTELIGSEVTELIPTVVCVAGDSTPKNSLT